LPQDVQIKSVAGKMNGSKNKRESESYNKFKSPDIITVIKVRRLELVGNVVITDGKGTVKKLI
jgi:hypothetical protein